MAQPVGQSYVKAILVLAAIFQMGTGVRAFIAPQSF
jgi:hypothetical protein